MNEEKYPVLAHRCGAIEVSKTIQENSIEAMKYCMTQPHIDGVEFDTRRTKDMGLVITHGSHIDLTHWYSAMSMEKIKSIKKEIATLKEFLDLAVPNKLIDVEIKRSFFKVPEFLDEYYKLVCNYPHLNIVTTSFSAPVINYLRKKDEHLALGIIFDKKYSMNIRHIKNVGTVVIKSNMLNGIYGKLLKSKLEKDVFSKKKNLIVWDIQTEQNFITFHHNIQSQKSNEVLDKVYICTNYPKEIQKAKKKILKRQ